MGYDSPHVSIRDRSVKLLLVFNPHAAAGRAADLLEPVGRALGHFADVDTHCTTGPGDAIPWLAAADLSRYDGVLAAGGDGTLFEVLNGLYEHAAGDRPPLGVIPVGTGNAFARDLGLVDREKAPESATHSTHVLDRKRRVLFGFCRARRVEDF